MEQVVARQHTGCAVVGTAAHTESLQTGNTSGLGVLGRKQTGMRWPA
jgi:hypothetical protein